MKTAPDISAVKTYLLELQDRVCAALEQEDAKEKFREDSWDRPEGGGGKSRVLAEGEVFEQAGVNFSHVHGKNLPPSATAHRPGSLRPGSAAADTLARASWSPPLSCCHRTAKSPSAVRRQSTGVRS